MAVQVQDRVRNTVRLHKGNKKSDKNRRKGDNNLKIGIRWRDQIWCSRW